MAAQDTEVVDPSLPERRASALPRLTDRLRLGKEGPWVSPVCLGRVLTPDTVCAAFDAGINFFFLTADMHWPFYEPTRRGLEMLLARGEAIRQQITVAVVSYVTQPEFCSYPFQEVVDAVAGLDAIDVPVAGGAYAPEITERLRVYHEHRARGYLGTKAIGASFHDRGAALRAQREGLVDVAFVRYNPGHAGARADLFPYFDAASEVAVYNFKSTSGYVSPARCQALGITPDHWYPEITDYYRFALARPEIDGLLCSPTTPPQVTALADALAKGPLSEEEERYLVDLSEIDEARPVL